MGLMVLAGAGLAIGILLVVHSLTPSRPDLTVALARIGRPTSGPLPNRTTLETLARSLGMDHLVTGSVATDLRMIGRTEGAHLARCLTIGLESAAGGAGTRRRLGARRHLAAVRGPSRPDSGAGRQRAWRCPTWSSAARPRSGAAASTTP